MKLLLSTGTGYLTHTLPEVEKMALALGYDGVEVVMPPRHKRPEESYRDTSYDKLTHAVSVHSPGDIYDQSRFRSALDDACGIASMVGASKVVAHPAALKYGGRDNIITAIKYIQEKQQQTNATIVYEALVDPIHLAAERLEGLQEQQAYSSVAEYVSDIQQFSLPACLDTAHLGTWLVDPETLVEPLGRQLQHVHLSDYDPVRKVEHLVPGSGSVALTPFLRTLANTHPDITLTVEIHPPTTVQTVENAARQSIEFIHHALGTK